MLDSNVYGHYFPVSAIDADAVLSGANDKRVLATINDVVKIPAGLMPLGDGNYYIIVNAELRRKLNIKLGDEVQIQMQKDRSEYGMPMPESLQEVLLTDEAAKKYFEALTPGKQRSLIYIVAKVKNVDSQIYKAMVIANHLKQQKGEIESKLLMQELKMSK